jgi:hypothetical protein
MANGLELLEQYVEQRNEAVDAFVSQIDRIRTAIEKDRVRGRAPVKMEGDNFYKFTLLGRAKRVHGKDEAIEHLNSLRNAAYDENQSEFRAVIEAAYAVNAPVEEEQPKRRGRKPKPTE